MKKLITLTAAVTLASTLNAFEIKDFQGGINLGKSYYNFKQSTEFGTGVEVQNAPDKNVNQAELYISSQCLFNDSLRNYFSYTYGDLNIAKNHMLLAGVTKEYSFDKVTLYSSILVGYGWLNFDEPLLEKAKKEDNTATSLLAGIQAGVKYPMGDNLYFNLNTKLIASDYNIKLTPNDQRHDIITSDYTGSILIGIGYKF